MRGAGRDVWVKIRASDAERAEWHAKARSAGLTLSDLVRRSVGRVRTWTAPATERRRGCTAMAVTGSVSGLAERRHAGPRQAPSNRPRRGGGDGQ